MFHGFLISAFRVCFISRARLLSGVRILPVILLSFSGSEMTSYFHSVTLVQKMSCYLHSVTLVQKMTCYFHFVVQKMTCSFHSVTLVQRCHVTSFSGSEDDFAMRFGVVRRQVRAS